MFITLSPLNNVFPIFFNNHDIAFPMLSETILSVRIKFECLSVISY